MKLTLLLIATVTGDLIGYNRGVNNAFQHVGAQLNTPNNDYLNQLVDHMLHSGKYQEAKHLIEKIRTRRFK